MYNTCKNPFVRSFFRCLFGGMAACILLCATVLIQTKDAYAKVCFLPGGKCPGDSTMSSVTAVQGNQCLGYTLTQIKCKDQACEEGWRCESCTNAQGTYYKCTEKTPPEGFTKGTYVCDTPCHAYEHNGFSGNQINGKCTKISGYSTTKPAECTTFQTPDYVYGIKVSGNSTEDLHSENKESYKCYYNVQPLSGGKFERKKPASCTTYDIKTDSYNEKCYANAVSIGDHFTTNKAEHFPNIFAIEEKAGTDGVTCYRVKRDSSSHCNSANGWSDNSPDKSIFDVEEKTLEGYTCYRAKGCNMSNVYSEELPDVKYFESDKHIASKAASYNGITCYRAKGCINGKGLDNVTHHAYTTQPDSRFFKSSTKTSNNKQCWIATGKADYAYASGDRKTKFFDYTTDNGKGTADVTATDGTITNTTYYVVKHDNGRNGCAAKAYEATRDDTYFGWTSLAHYSNGSSSTKTCYNATGCRSNYAYLNKDNTTHFAYDDGKKAYFNGDGNETSCYKLTGCSGNAYTKNTENTNYFAYDIGKDSYQEGKAIKCYNVTGCRPNYAYLSKDNTTHFAYDDGQKAHFNGNTAETTCYKLTGCSGNAYDKNTENTDHFAYDIGKDSYKDGATIKCYNVTGCRPNYAYLSKDNTTHFAYDGGQKAHFKGATDETTCYKLTGCATKAYAENSTDIKTAFFKYDNKDSYKEGNAIKCYNATGCSDYAYNVNTADTDYFSYTPHENYIKGAGDKTACYNVSGCNTDGGAETSKPSETIFVVSSRAAYKNGTASSAGTKNLTCYRADSCNATNHYSTTKPLVAHFTESHDTKSGITCYVATGCAAEGDNTSDKPKECKTYSTKVNGTIYCYHNISTTGADDCTLDKPTGCRTWSAGTDTNGNTVYYSISDIFGKDCVTSKPSCKTWSQKQNSDGTLYYYGISAEFGTSCTKSPTSCYNYSSKKDSENTTWYYNPKIVATGASTTKPTGCQTWSSGAGTNGTTCYWGASGKFANDCTTDKPGECKTYNTKDNTEGTTYYYSISTTGAGDCQTTAPGDCKNYSTGKDTNGNTVYYSISDVASGASTTKPGDCQTWSSGAGTNGTTCYWGASGKFANDCTTTKPGDCMIYSTKDNTEGTTYYYSISSIADDATTTKPSVTTASCHTYSTKNGTNGNLCYYNIKAPSKPSELAHCGTCGKTTRTVTCNDDGTGWTDPKWSECTEFTADTSRSVSCTDTTTCTLYQNCGTCGYQSRTGSKSRSGSQAQTRTATCKKDGTGFSYNDWTNSGSCVGSGNYGTCSSSNAWGNCVEAKKVLTQDCSYQQDCTVYFDCGTCGNRPKAGKVNISASQARTVNECKGDTTSRYWTYNDWEECKATGAGACTVSGDFVSDCSDPTPTTTANCSTNCELTQSCGCNGTQSRTGTKSGTKSRTATCKGSNGTGGSSSPQRYYEYSEYGECGNYGECTSSAEWGNCSSSCSNTEFCCGNSCHAKTVSGTSDCGCGGKIATATSYACVNGSVQAVGGGPVSGATCSKSDCSSGSFCCNGTCYVKKVEDSVECADGRGTQDRTNTRYCSNGVVKNSYSYGSCSCKNVDTSCSSNTDKEWNGATCQCEYVSCQYGYGGGDAACGGRTAACKKICNENLNDNITSCQEACMGNQSCRNNCSYFCSEKCAYCGSDNKCHRSTYPAP